MILDKSWKFNTLNIYDYTKPGPYDYIFKYLREELPPENGDILEAGTFHGRMTLSMAHFISQVNPKATVHTFDTFAGFPSYSEMDSLENFEILRDAGLITSKHFDDFLTLREFKESFTNRDVSVANISTSGDFSKADLNSLRKKIELLGLGNIRIYEGDFKDTMNDVTPINRLGFAFLDCDLYQGYVDSLNFVDTKLNIDGVIFLDEYYSLKFPGPRFAVNAFLSLHENYKLKNIGKKQDDFERWILRKFK